MVTKVYSCLESPETAIMDEKLGVSVLPRAVFILRFFINMTVY